MVLIVHHLGISQSERVVWLLEELELPYKLVKHTRGPILSPDTLKNVNGNKTGKAPFVEDSDTGVKLGESGAICEYIIHKYGGGRFAAMPNDQNYSDYLYWFHYANAGLQPAMITSMFTELSGVADGDRMKSFAKQRLDETLRLIDDRLKSNKWLAGSDFTAADIMTVYSLTTQRYFGPQVSFANYQNILRYLQDCSQRLAYRRAMEKGDPMMKLLLGAKAPEKSILETGGVDSKNWKQN